MSSTPQNLSGESALAKYRQESIPSSTGSHVWLYDETKLESSLRTFLREHRPSRVLPDDLEEEIWVACPGRRTTSEEDEVKMRAALVQIECEYKVLVNGTISAAAINGASKAKRKQTLKNNFRAQADVLAKEGGLLTGKWAIFTRSSDEADEAFVKLATSVAYGGLRNSPIHTVKANCVGKESSQPAFQVAFYFENIWDASTVEAVAESMMKEAGVRALDPERVGVPPPHAKSDVYSMLEHDGKYKTKVPLTVAKLADLISVGEQDNDHLKHYRNTYGNSLESNCDTDDEDRGTPQASTSAGIHTPSPCSTASGSASTSAAASVAGVKRIADTLASDYQHLKPPYNSAVFQAKHARARKVSRI